MIKAATVNKTTACYQYINNVSGRSQDLPSMENGPKNMTQNTVYQYGQAGSVNAMSSGDTAAMNDEMQMR